MDQSNLEGCIIFLDKLKTHLTNKGNVHKKIVNNFQILSELQQMSVQVLDSAQFQPELEHDLLNEQYQHFSQMKQNMQLNALLLENEFLKPIKKILKHNQKLKEDLIDELRQLINLTQLKYQQMSTTKNSYYQKSQDYEKMDQIRKDLLMDIQLGIRKQQSYQEYEEKINQKDKDVKRFKEQYEFDLKTLNSFLEKIKDNFKIISEKISKLQGQNDAFIKCKLEQFERIKNYFYKNGLPQEKITSQYYVERLKTMEQTNQQKLIIEIYDQYRELLDWTNSQNYYHKFLSYERYKQEQEKEKCNEFKMIPFSSDIDDLDQEQINFILEYIFSSYGSKQNKPLEEDKLIELFTKQVSISFFLKEFKKKLLKFEGEVRLQKQKGLYLKVVFRSILDQKMKFNKITIESFYNILCIFDKLSFFDQEQLKNFYEELADQQIWQQIDIWIDLYKYLRKKQSRKHKNDYIQNLTSAYKNIKKMIKQQFEEQESDLQKTLIEQNQRKKLLLNIVNYLKKLRKGINLKLFQEIIQEIIKVYKIQDSTAIDIFDKFEDEYVFQQIKYFLNSKERNQKLQKFWGKQIIFKLAYEYLTLTDKSKLILINKKINNQLTPQFYIDITYASSYNERIRNNLWTQILDIKNSPCLEDGNIANKNIDESYKRLIQADINRTLTKEEDFPRDQLGQILTRQTYLMRNTINYCQGMNYLAAFFLKYYKDKNIAFKYYYQILQLKMFDIFQDGFEKLQAQFYVLDKLIKIHLPKLSQHFEDIGVKSQYFGSSWMITLFSFVLQETQYSYMIQTIFDIFMVENYLGFYKICITILKFLENYLKQLNFDYCLQFFCNLQHNEIFVNSQFKKYLKDKEKLNQNQLKKQYAYHKEYDFVYNFKNLCNQVEINNAFIVFFEQRYMNIKSKMQKDKDQNYNQFYYIF